jgi:polar amino acid transport system substrate-binding protein
MALVLKKFVLKGLAASLVVSGALQGCAHAPWTEAGGTTAAAQGPSVATSVVQTLAPQGALRVAMYRGSPTSFVQAQPNDPPRGVNYELGQAFAKRLGVAFQPMVFNNNADALRAVAAGQADFTFTNATGERGRVMDFSPTVMDVEKSVLVAQSSPIRSLDDVKQPGLRIGVSAGSSTGEELHPLYPQAVLVSVATLDKAVDMLRAGQLDGFATNKAILFEMGDKLAGSRVVPGHWGMEHFAIGIPKGRAAGSIEVAAFVRDARAQGVVTAAAKRANLRGVVQ